MRDMPADCWEEVPPGAERVSSRSGTPEILAVKRMEPEERAEMARPEGEKMRERDSTMST